MNKKDIIFFIFIIIWLFTVITEAVLISAGYFNKEKLGFVNIFFVGILGILVLVKFIPNVNNWLESSIIKKIKSLREIRKEKLKKLKRYEKKKWLCEQFKLK